MAISALSASAASAAPRCLVTLDILSGRPNPHWAMEASECATLLERLDALPPADGAAVPDPPGLGYRGVVIVRPDGKEPVRLFGGIVTSDPEGIARRIDHGRLTEISVLRASRGHLPKGLVDAALADAGG